MYHLTNGNDKLICEWFGKLKDTGVYEVNDEVKVKLGELFYAGCCTDEETKEQINKTFREEHYLIDTHSAVALKVYDDYRRNSGDNTKTVIASTANPYKFGKAVYEALGESEQISDEFEVINRLEKLTGTVIPAPLAATKDKAVRFNESVNKENMSRVVLDFLNS